tara:strand:+ start:50 stop:538 length:489 start_codon:yes stop_codon:yes gene_type:complete
VKIEVNNREITSALDALQNAIGNVDPALKEIGDYLIDSTKQRFIKSEAPDGSRWKDNSPVTLLNYASRFKTKRARISRLQNKKPGIGETGTLSDAIYKQVGSGVLELGSPLKYASTFQFGAKKGQYGKRTPWGDIPAREFLGLSDDDQEATLDIIRAHFAFA